MGYSASSVGALVCGGMVNFMCGPSVGYSRAQAYKVTMIVYSLLALIPLILFGSLSSVVEVPAIRAKAGPVANFLGLHKSRGIVMGLACLFMVDAFAGGFTLQSM